MRAELVHDRQEVTGPLALAPGQGFAHHPVLRAAYPPRSTQKPRRDAPQRHQQPRPFRQAVIARGGPTTSRALGPKQFPSGAARRRAGRSRWSAQGTRARGEQYLDGSARSHTLAAPELLEPSHAQKRALHPQILLQAHFRPRRLPEYQPTSVNKGSNRGVRKAPPPARGGAGPEPSNAEGLRGYGVRTTRKNICALFRVGVT